MHRNKTGCFFVLVLFNLSLQGQHDYRYALPPVLNDGWETADLRATPTDTTRLYQLLSQLHLGPNKMHSMLIVKDGQLVVEEYFNESHLADSHDLRSVTKSFRSLLMGIALDQGFIESIDDPIFKYLPHLSPGKHPDSRKQQITIRHLLTMASGLDCNDWDKKSAGQEDKVHKKKDWLQFTIDLPMLHDPGAVSSYCSMGTVLVAEIISQASGMPIDRFAAQYLFEPLGITQHRWGHTSNKAVIPAAKRLYMTSRDLAKIGKLIMDNGVWYGSQIVSKSWLTESTSMKTQLAGRAYGYLWWHIPIPHQGKTYLPITAMGNGGQYLFLLPDLQLMVVFTGGAYNSPDDKLPFAIMQKVVLPIFATD